MGFAMLALSSMPAMAANTVRLTNTGPYSKQFVGIDAGRKVKVNNIQGSYLVNNVSSSANTGNNNNNGNTNVTGTGTGAADSTTGVLNSVNGSTTVIKEDCGCEPNNTVEMTNTGPGSVNEAYINSKSKIKVNNIQLSYLQNNVSSSANSGGNNVNGNTNASGAGTGGATSKTSLTNGINVAETYINVTPTPVLQ